MLSGDPHWRHFHRDGYYYFQRFPAHLDSGGRHKLPHGWHGILPAGPWLPRCFLAWFVFYPIYGAFQLSVLDFMPFQPPSSYGQLSSSITLRLFWLLCCWMIDYPLADGKTANSSWPPFAKGGRGFSQLPRSNLPAFILVWASRNTAIMLATVCIRRPLLLRRF